jgi:hypothetical protein
MTLKSRKNFYMIKSLVPFLSLLICSASFSQVQSKSFFVKPQFSDGRVTGFSAGVGIDGRNANALALSTLGNYTVMGKTFSTVGVLSTNKYGDKAAVGVGVLVPLGRVVNGVSLSAGAYVEGVDLANKFSSTDKVRALVTASVKIDDFTKMLGFKF